MDLRSVSLLDSCQLHPSKMGGKRETAHGNMARSLPLGQRYTGNRLFPLRRVRGEREPPLLSCEGITASEDWERAASLGSLP